MTDKPQLQNHYPPNNQEVAEQLYVLEVGLRELIIETLSEEDSAKWHKTLLPHDITQKYLRGIQTERASNWTTHTPHHPIYYIDFPDLAKILDSNWKKLFKELFPKKEIFISSLRSLEPIRNKLAHNRKISSEDCSIVKSVSTFFVSAIGEIRLGNLVDKCTSAPSIKEITNNLKNEITNLSKFMSALDQTPDPDVWNEIKEEWWFDTNFLTGNNHVSKLDQAESKLKELQKEIVSTEKEIKVLRENLTRTKQCEDIIAPIVKFYLLHDEYNALPRNRGTGHKLEFWRENSNIKELSKEAINTLNSLHPGDKNE
ncbi:MAG: Swt1 family HEPN domain-containing protein [bacterium]|nr:Swt1 family HEPN domain-containing protein [bacterium]